MAEIAEATGVSKATVSRALAGSNLIGQDVRDEINEVAKKLGYVKRLVRRHGERCILTVKLVLPPVKNRTSNLFFSLSDLVEGLRSGLSPANVNVLVESGGDDYAPYPHKKGGEVEAFVFAFHRPSEEVLEEIQEHGASVVVLNRSVKNTRQVVSHHQQALGLVAEHLASKGVNGQCCFVAYRGIEDVAKDRLAGFKKAARSYGIDFDSKRDFWLVDGPEDLSSEEVLRRHTAGVRNFVGVNDVVGALLISLARDAGLAVPGDLRITGCDNAPLRGVTIPKLTTVELSMHALAKMAGDSLYTEIIEGGSAEQSLYVSGKLLVGGTT